MSDIKKYTEKWEIGEKIGDGGQGTTYKTRLLGNNPLVANNIVAIKLLKSQKVTERRGRMRRETTALETLNHPGIAKYIDSNTEYWENEAYHLFIATEYIQGPTLEEFDVSHLSLADKIKLTIKICEAVDYCHDNNIIHRDIKPENIIIKDGSIENPVIIDFGLSFNSLDNDIGNKTPDWQQIGNRFLILPEQKVGEVAKRDFRSDVAFLVGIFFYILTDNQVPVNLLNQHQQKPHQRDGVKELIDALPYYQRVLINKMFDTGFEPMINRRWQTVQSLISQLNLLLQASPMDPQTAVELAEQINSHIEGMDNSYEVTITELFDRVDEEAEKSFNSIKEQLDIEKWTSSKKNSLQGIGHMAAPYDYQRSRTNVIVLKNNSKISIELSYICFVTGSELVVGILNQGKDVEIFRQPIDNEIDWAIIYNRFNFQWLQYILDKLRN